MVKIIHYYVAIVMVCQIQTQYHSEQYESSIEPVKTQNYYISAAVFLAIDPAENDTVNELLTKVFTIFNDLRIWLQHDTYRNKGYNLKLHLNYISHLPDDLHDTFFGQLKNASVPLYYNLSKTLTNRMAAEKINLIIVASNARPDHTKGIGTILGRASFDERFYYYHLFSESKCALVNTHEFSHTVLLSMHDTHSCKYPNVKTIMYPRLTPCPTSYDNFKSGIECDRLVKIPRNDYERTLNIHSMNGDSTIFRTQINIDLQILDVNGNVRYEANRSTYLAPFLQMFNYNIPCTVDAYNSDKGTIEFANTLFALSELVPVGKSNTPRRVWSSWDREIVPSGNSPHLLEVARRKCLKSNSIFDTCPTGMRYDFDTRLFYHGAQSYNMPARGGKCFYYSNKGEKTMLYSGEPCTATADYRVYVTRDYSYLEKFRNEGICVEGVCTLLDPLLDTKLRGYSIVKKTMVSLDELLYPTTLIISCEFNDVQTYPNVIKSFLKWVNETTPILQYSTYPIDVYNNIMRLQGTSLCNRYVRYFQANITPYKPRGVMIVKLDTKISITSNIFRQYDVNYNDRNICSMTTLFETILLNEYQCLKYDPYYQLEPIYYK